jgi:hypothetical protein
VSEQDRLGRTDRVEDRAEVVGPHVEVGGLLPVGEPGPALVEEDQAGEGGQPVGERGVHPILELDLEVRSEPVDVHEVGRTIAADLERDVHAVDGLRVSGLSIHRSIVSGWRAR